MLAWPGHASAIVLPHNPDQPGADMQGWRQTVQLATRLLPDDSSVIGMQRQRSHAFRGGVYVVRLHTPGLVF